MDQNGAVFLNPSKYFRKLAVDLQTTVNEFERRIEAKKRQEYVKIHENIFFQHGSSRHMLQDQSCKLCNITTLLGCIASASVFTRYFDFQLPFVPFSADCDFLK